MQGLELSHSELACRQVYAQLKVTQLTVTKVDLTCTVNNSSSGKVPTISGLQYMLGGCQSCIGRFGRRAGPRLSNDIHHRHASCAHGCPARQHQKVTQACLQLTATEVPHNSRRLSRRVQNCYPSRVSAEPKHIGS